MNIYLKWNPIFIEEKAHLPIFDLNISQEETCFAKAHLIIDALASLPPPGTEGVIQGETGEPFFKGILVGKPIKMEGDLAEIELIARPPDFLEKSMVLQKESRMPPYWDELWIRSEHQNDFQHLQDVRHSALYCDRRTGALSWSDWFEGKQTLPIHQHFFAESLQTKVVKAPLKACTVKVHAHWVQSESGVASVSASIRKAFPHFKVSTYTKNSLLKKWPQPGQRLGKSGIWVIKSGLKPVFPSSPLYPRFSPPLPLGEEGDQPKLYRAQRHWFKPSLWVGWQVHQRRKETLSLTLVHDFQPFLPGEGEVKQLEFTLQNINPDPKTYPWGPENFYRNGTKAFYRNKIYKCKEAHTSKLSFEEDQTFWSFKKIFHTPLGNPARDSFFLTERGYQAAEHAMERAKVALAKSARCLEVTFEGPWDSLKDVTTDTSITLADPRLPGRKIIGKVVKYALLAKGETGERFGRITLLCTLGAGKIELTHIINPLPTYALEGYAEANYQVYENRVRQTPSGLTYFTYENQTPPNKFKSGPLLRGIDLSNGPKEQEQEMQRYAYKSPALVKKALSQKPTRLRLFFKDLRTQERMEHLIAVKMAASWSAPPQCSKEDEKGT